MYDAFALRSVDLQPTDPKSYEEETWHLRNSQFPWGNFRYFRVIKGIPIPQKVFQAYLVRANYTKPSSASWSHEMVVKRKGIPNKNLKIVCPDTFEDRGGAGPPPKKLF